MFCPCETDQCEYEENEKFISGAFEFLRSSDFFVYITIAALTVKVAASRFFGKKQKCNEPLLMCVYNVVCFLHKCKTYLYWMTSSVLLQCCIVKLLIIVHAAMKACNIIMIKFPFYS